MPRASDVGPPEPVEIVVVGHFDDRRSSLCPDDVEDACRDRFVVDRVAWVSGTEQPSSLVIGVERLDSTEDEIAAVVGGESPGGRVLSTAIVDGATGIGRIEPSLGTGRGGFIDQRAIWVVRVLEDSLTVTYLVVDGTDAIFEMRADGKPVGVGGTLPTPSEAPGGPSSGGWGPLAVVPPQGGADTARTEGELRITDSCVFLATRGGHVLLLWPADRTTWNAQARTIAFSNYDGSTVSAGDGTAVVLGGSGDRNEESGTTTEAWLARTPWVARPAGSCPVASRWWVGALTR